MLESVKGAVKVLMTFNHYISSCCGFLAIVCVRVRRKEGIREGLIEEDDWGTVRG